jgi:hypothetical protein
MQSVSSFVSTNFSSPDDYMRDDAGYIPEQQCENQKCFDAVQTLPYNASFPPPGWRENSKNQSGYADGFVESSVCSMLGFQSHQIYHTRDPDNPRLPNQPGIASTFQKLTMQKPDQLNESIHFYPVVEANSFASHLEMNSLPSPLLNEWDPPPQRSQFDPSELPMYCRTESAPSCLDYARAQINLDLFEECPHPDPSIISGEVMRTCSAPLPYTGRTHASKRQSSIDDYLALERPRRRSIREFISILTDDQPGGLHPRPQPPSLTLDPMTGQLPTVCKVAPAQLGTLIRA